MKILEHYLGNGIFVAIFLLLLAYSQSGYAVIEKYLTPISTGFYKLAIGTDQFPKETEAVELYIEIENYLKKDCLKEVFIRYLCTQLPDSARYLILNMIADSLRRKAPLTLLDLRSNRIKAQDFKLFIESLAINQTVTTLDLWDNHLGAEGARLIGRALRTNTTLTTLALGHNHLGSNGTRELAEALRTNNTLTNLDIRTNDISLEGIKALTKMLQVNTTLTILNLSSNNLDLDSIKLLAKTLQFNTALTTLDLSGNNLGPEGIRAIADALRINNTLAVLRLWFSNLTQDSVRMLVDALRDNSTLTILDLRGNSIPDTEKFNLYITQALIDNYSLLEFYSVSSSKLYKKILLRNNLLVQLLRKIKRASAFTLTIGFYDTPLRPMLPNILEYAGLDMHDRPRFTNVRHYNSEATREIIFSGSLEEIIRLFYYGDNADYREILREVNTLRCLQREILQENLREIPQTMVELPEVLPTNDFLLGPRDEGEWRQNLVRSIFWTS